MPLFNPDGSYVSSPRELDAYEALQRRGDFANLGKSPTGIQADPAVWTQPPPGGIGQAPAPVIPGSAQIPGGDPSVINVLPPNAIASPQFTDPTGFLNPSLEGVAPQVEPTPTRMPADIAENYPAVEPTTSGATPSFPGGTGAPPPKPAVPTQRTTERDRTGWATPDDSLFATGVPDFPTTVIRGGVGFANFLNDLFSSRHVGPGPDENPEHLARRQLIENYRRRMEEMYPRGPKYSSEHGGLIGAIIEMLKQSPHMGEQGTNVTPASKRNLPTRYGKRD